MNKQRQVLITTTYNEMGIIVDIKAEKVEQPNLQPTCNQLATDCISRQQTITALRALSDEDGYINAPHEVVTDVVRGLPPVQAKHEQTTQPERGKTDKLGVKAGGTYKDTIYRQAAYNALMAEPLKWDDSSVWESARCHQWMMDMDVIKALPPVQPERKTGKWIPLISTSDEKHHEWCGYQCSICGERTLRLMQHNYCPFCGADMRGEQND